jgi:hypothetical protein
MAYTKPRSNSQGVADTTAELAQLTGRPGYTVLVKDYGTFEWVDSGTANGVDIFAGQSGYWSLVSSSSPNAQVGIKVYRATLTQTSTSAPTATVMENSFGAAIVWARSNTGVYTATLADAFTSAKTFIVNAGLAGTVAAPKDVTAVRTSANVVTVSTGAAGVAEDAVLSSYPIEIIVYP